MHSEMTQLMTRHHEGDSAEIHALATYSNGGKGDIVFVDPTIPDHAEQIRSIEDWAEVVVLDPMGDGVHQIAAEIKNRWDLSRIHILAHGMPGALLLGSASLCTQTIGLYARQIAVWGRALNVTGEIIFYGSDVGQGEKGEFFLRRISDLTQAGVSATRGPLGKALPMVA